MSWFVAQNIAIATALAALAALVCRIRQVGPAARHALWLVVLVKLVTPPMIVLQSPWALPAISVWLTEERAVDASGVTLATEPLPTATATLEPDSIPATVEVAPEASAPLVTPQQIEIGVISIWLIGALTLLGVQTVRTWRVARRVGRGEPAPESFLHEIAPIARRLGLGPVRVRIVDGITSPLVWCLNPLKPTLLWPASLPADQSTACMHGLITHELAHIKRRDHWVGWIELIAGVCWWWNPLFWFVRGRLRENAELACDAWVVEAMPDGRRAYAEALLAACSVSPSRLAPMPAVGISTSSRRFLERRLAMIMQGRAPVRVSRLATASLLLVATATLPVWAARLTPASAPDGQDPKPVIITPTLQAKPITVVKDGSVLTVTPKLQAKPTEVKPEGNLGEFWTAFADDQSAQLPDEAQKLIQKFEDQQAAMRKDLDAKLSAQRDDLVKQLQALQDSFTKSGKLDEAVAIRNRIRSLNAGTDAAWSLRGNRIAFSRGFTTPTLKSAPVARAELKSGKSGAGTLGALFRRDLEPAQTAMQALRGQTGASLVAEITGADPKEVTVWGTDVYTDDSSIAGAAVHAGLLKPGEKALLRIVILAGQDSYRGSERNGVKSENYGSWAGSFKLERVK